MCHIVGVTPEARTLGQALGNKRPEDTVKVGETEMRQTWEQLNTGDASKVDLVIFGCPHCTILEISEIASLLEGKRLRKDVRLSIGTSDAMYGLARQAGYARIIEEAGGRFTHCCAGPVNPLVHLCEPEVVATNSARAAHYIPRATAGKTGVFYGDTRSCIDSATTG